MYRINHQIFKMYRKVLHVQIKIMGTVITHHITILIHLLFYCGFTTEKHLTNYYGVFVIADVIAVCDFLLRMYDILNEYLYLRVTSCLRKNWSTWAVIVFPKTNT